LSLQVGRNGRTLLAVSLESVRDAPSFTLRNPGKCRQNPGLPVSPALQFPIPAMPLYSLLTRIPRPLYLATALTLYLLLLWMGGHQPTVDHLPGRADFSKVYHLVFYSGWCCLAWMSMREPGIVAAVALTVLAGAGDELHQYFLPFREARVTDVLIDGCAALGGALAMHALRQRAMRLEEAKVS
jgi:VanZ family protein